MTGTLKRTLSAFPTSSLGPVGGLLGAGLVAGFGAALIGIAKEFGSARRQIIQETGQTGKDLEGTFATVKRVFADVPASLHDVTTAVDLLRQRGVPLGAQLDELAKQEIELSKITKTDLASNVETTTALFAKFGVSLRDQPAALDAIFKASQQGGQGLVELTGSLRSGGTILKQFGFNISESAALIATLEKAGVNVQPALAGLKKAFGEITKSGGNPRKVLNDLIKEFSDGTPQAKAMADAMKLFGNRSGAELAAAIKAGKFQVKDLIKLVTDGKGGIQATAEETRTLAERFEILKNRASLALEPLASAVWKTVKQVIIDLQGPLGNLVVSLGKFAKAAAPLAAVFGVALLGTFKAIGPLLDLVGTGLGFVADVLSHIPTPVLIAVGAIAALAKAFIAVKAAMSSLAGLQALGQGFALLTNPIFIAVAALAAIGLAVKLFSGQASAASVESKALSKSLFAVGASSTLFKDGITSAVQGLTEFLVAQDEAGKNSNLKDALDGTGTTLREVGRAVAGTSQDFERLKASVVDTSGFNDQQRALLASGKAGQLAAQQMSGLTQEQLKAVQAAQDQVSALDQQRDAFIKSAQAELEASLRSGDLGKAQFAQAEAIAHNTTGIRGYGAALDFANVAIGEHARKQQAAADRVVIAKGGQEALTKAVLDGTIGTDDATLAVGKFGLSLDKTKDIISKTQDMLKAFVDQGLAGFGDTSSIINDWSSNIDKAFTDVANASGKSSEEVKKAQDELKAATDPGIVVANLQKQAAQIEQFSTNILKIVERFPAAARALIADPNKGAAAAMAQAIINNPTIGRQFDAAQSTVQSRTAQLKALLEGPLSAQLLGGGASLGKATTKGYTDNVKFDAPTETEVVKATAVIEKHRSAHATQALRLALGAGTLYAENFDLKGPSSKQVIAARSVLDAAKKTVGGAAGATGKEATDAYGKKIDLPGETKTSLGGAAGVFTGPEAQTVALRASIQGGRIGVAFGEGIASGIGSEQVIRDIGTAAGKAAQTAIDAAEAKIKPGSPSKVGIELGKSFGDGLAVGIGSAVPRVKVAADGMANRLVGAFDHLTSTRGLVTAQSLARSVPAVPAHDASSIGGDRKIADTIVINHVKDNDDAVRKLTWAAKTRGR